MASEMWQRIKQARKASDKTQLQMAKALGITRSGYAFLETPHEQYRTTPNITQPRTISSFTGVPLDLIVNDSTDLADVVRSKLPGYVHQRQSDPAQERRPGLPESEDMRAMFWAAVQFACVTRGLPDLRFDQQVSPPPLEVRVGCLGNRAVAVMADEPSPADTVRAIGLLLSAERAISKSLGKTLIVFSRSPVDVRAIAAQAKSTFGVDVRVATSADQAAEILSKIT